MRPRLNRNLVATTSEDKSKKSLAKKNFLLYLQTKTHTSRYYIKMFGKKQYIPKDKIDLYKQGAFEIFTE